MNKLLILCLLFVVYFASAKKIPGPLFMWSNQQVFNHKKINLMNAESSSVESLLENIVSISNDEGDLSKYLNKETQFPEVITIFLKPHLTSSKFSVSANVYQKGKKGGSYSNLKSILENSDSTLSVHYSNLKDSFAQDVLSKFQNKLREVYPNAKTILSSANKDDVSHFPESHKWIPISTIEEYLVSGEGKEYVLNGTPDILVVYFSTEERQEVISSEDRIIGIVSNVVSVSTNKNYIGLFSSDVPEEHTFPSISEGLKDNNFYSSKIASNIRSSNDSDVAGTYFPPQMWQAIIVVFIILMALFIGVNTTMQLQIPPKLLDEAMAKKKKN